jgi:hypothetical protein
MELDRFICIRIWTKEIDRDDYTHVHGDLNINRFIFMVLLFVLSMIFLIIRPNMISILLG